MTSPGQDGLIYFIYDPATYSFTIIERIMFQDGHSEDQTE